MPERKDMTKKKSILMTPDPHHTPGYGGYVPHLKYKLGRTFGKHTHQLLTSKEPQVSSSGNIILSDILPCNSSVPEVFSSPIYHGRSRSWGDQKYVTLMVPGYTGFIPARQHQFGSRYAEICHKAFTTFEKEQIKHQSKMAELREATLGKSVIHLTPISSKAKPYFSTTENSQYSMASHVTLDGRPQRYFVSGYTGFVPRVRKYLGQGYPIISSLAFREHIEDGKRRLRTRSEPIILDQPKEKVSVLVGIYPKETGLIPRYSGHIPGQKFRFGRTFGASTKNTFPELET